MGDALCIGWLWKCWGGRCLDALTFLWIWIMESLASVGTFDQVILPLGELLEGSSHAFISYLAAGPHQGPPGPPGWWHLSPLLPFLSLLSDLFGFPFFSGVNDTKCETSALRGRGRKWKIRRCDSRWTGRHKVRKFPSVVRVIKMHLSVVSHSNETEGGFAFGADFPERWNMTREKTKVLFQVGASYTFSCVAARGYWHRQGYMEMKLSRHTI